jgi:MFS superfamily sulfate permease-like transporter
LGGAGAATGYAGYPHALGAILIGGILVAILGLLKVGKVGDFFPRAAVRGMLAAIGVIIIIKQLFPALGVASPNGSLLWEASKIPAALLDWHGYTLTVSLITLGVLIGHPFVKWTLIRLIPAPLWVLLITVPFVQIVAPQQVALVEMPDALLGQGGIQWPSFAKLGEAAFWVAVLGVAMVSGIETLLSAKAVDSLDPHHRTANLNKDLLANGVGSSVAASLGGLPMISEIVRSSANIRHGAVTQWANFFHGSFLLVYVLIGSAVIEMIPIAALSTILVFTGFRLASPTTFREMYAIGWLELLLFLVTLVAVLATDLILGIAIGVGSKYLILLASGIPIRSFFKLRTAEHISDDGLRLTLSDAVLFANYLPLLKKIQQAWQTHTTVILDVGQVQYIDHTVMEHLHTLKTAAARQGKQLLLAHVDNLQPASGHPLAARRRKLNALPGTH